MKRIVQPELLDSLSPDDPRAVRSRSDLLRLNRIMRHSQILSTTLTARLKHPLRTITEIGAGDGTLMLQLASHLYARWPEVRVTLVDRQRTVSDETLKRFVQFRWQPEVVRTDVFDWLEHDKHASDVIVANLFLHHFTNEQLAELLMKIAARSQFFVACETRRDRLSLVVSRLLGCIGCNSVTRNDAPISVKAGFAGNEISSLWPRDGWQLSEKSAGMFSHLFTAQQNGKRA